MKNNSSITIRLPSDLKKEFVELTEKEDIAMPQILRRCIKDYIKKNKNIKN